MKAERIIIPFKQLYWCRFEGRITHLVYDAQVSFIFLSAHGSCIHAEKVVLVDRELHVEAIFTRAWPFNLIAFFIGKEPEKFCRLSDWWGARDCGVGAHSGVCCLIIYCQSDFERVTSLRDLGDVKFLPFSKLSSCLDRKMHGTLFQKFFGSLHLIFVNDQSIVNS